MSVSASDCVLEVFCTNTVRTLGFLQSELLFYGLVLISLLLLFQNLLLLVLVLCFSILRFVVLLMVVLNSILFTLLSKQ